MAKLLDALKRNRHGDRDRLIGLLIFRHGLRVSEACDLAGTTPIYRNDRKEAWRRGPLELSVGGDLFCAMGTFARAPRCI
jgi:hypothetical protein